MVTPVDAVGNYEDAGTDPAEHSQNFDQHFLLYEGNGEEAVEVGALAEHPGVVGDGEVGGEDVEQAAPDGVSSPDLVLTQHSEVPHQPEHAAGQQGQAEVVVHHHPAGLEGAGEGEDAAGDEEEQDGDGQTNGGDVVDIHSNVRDQYKYEIFLTDLKFKSFQSTQLV